MSLIINQKTNDEFKQKYLKYKEKYLKLKNKSTKLIQKGGYSLQNIGTQNVPPGQIVTSCARLPNGDFLYTAGDRLFHIPIPNEEDPWEEEAGHVLPIRRIQNNSFVGASDIDASGEYILISTLHNLLGYNYELKLEFEKGFPRNKMLISAKILGEYIICLVVLIIFSGQFIQIEVLRLNDRSVIRTIDVTDEEDDREPVSLLVTNDSYYIIFDTCIKKYNHELNLLVTSDMISPLGATIIDNNIIVLNNDPRFNKILVLNTNLEIVTQFNNLNNVEPRHISSSNGRLLIAGYDPVQDRRFFNHFVFEHQAVSGMLIQPAQPVQPVLYPVEPIPLETINKMFEEISTQISTHNFGPVNSPSINLYFVETTDPTDGVHTMSFSFVHVNNITDIRGQILREGRTINNMFTQLYHSKAVLDQVNPKPFFIFYNMLTNVRQEGIDAGGLTKTVFLRLSDLLNSPEFSFFLVKDPQTRYFRLNIIPASELTEDIRLKITFLGQLFGIIIKLKQQIYIDLDPFLLYQMVNNDFYTLTPQQIIQILTDFDQRIFNYNPYKCFSEDGWRDDQNCQWVENVEDVEGDLVPAEIANRFAETSTKIKEAFRLTNEITTLFITGFRSSFPIYNIFSGKPVRLLDMVIVGNRNLTLEVLLTTIRFVGFTDEQIDYMKEIIRGNYEDAGSTKEYLEKLLELITGTARMPSGGYPQQHPLSIKLTPTSRVPYDIHTCFNYIEINIQRFIEAFSGGMDSLRTSNLYQSFSLLTINNVLAAGFNTA